MSRESLLVLLDNMKDRMNCLETRSKIEETSLDTLKQNMEKIEKTTSEINSIKDNLLASKKEPENTKGAGSSKLKTEPNKGRSGVRGKSSKPLARNKTTANLKATNTSTIKKGQHTTSTSFNTKPKGNSAVKTSRNVAKIQKEEEKSTPVKQNVNKKGNNNLTIKPFSAKSTAKTGKIAVTESDKGDNKKNENKKEDKKDVIKKVDKKDGDNNTSRQEIKKKEVKEENKNNNNNVKDKKDIHNVKKEEKPSKKEKEAPKKVEETPKKQEEPSKKEEKPIKNQEEEVLKKEEQQSKKDEEPPKKDEEPPKKEEEPPKKDEEPPKKDEEPPKKEEEPPKEEVIKKEEEIPKNDEEKPIKTEEEPKKEEEPIKSEEKPKEEEEPPKEETPKEEPPKKEQEELPKDEKEESPKKDEEEPTKNEKEEPIKLEEEPPKEEAPNKEEETIKKEEESKEVESLKKEQEEPSKEEQTQINAPIINFLNSNKIFYKPTVDLTSTDTQTLKSILSDMMSNFNNHIEEIQTSIAKLKESNSEESLAENIPEFTLTETSQKAIETLNTEDKHINIFQEETPSNEIIIVYRLYFQLSHSNKKFSLIESNDTFWKDISQHIIDNSNKELGTFISNEVSTFDLSDENILVLSKMIIGYEKILTPSYYSSISPTTELFMTVLKDVFEYSGLLSDNEVLPARMNKNLSYEYEKYKQLIKEVEQLQEGL